MSNPLVSVLMPVYNGGRFLNEAIDSILNQTLKEFELVIINDSSDDNSSKIIGSYKDERIKVINNKKNLGFIGALNVGLENIETKYVACMNQDDISYPKRLETQLNYLEENENIFLVGSSAIYINEHGKEIRRFRKYNDYKMLAWRLRRSNGIIYPSIMFRNKEVRFDNNYEYSFYHNLLKRGENLTNLPEFLVEYRVHDKAISTYDKENQGKLMKETMKEFSKLEDINIIKKIFYSIKLIIHHLRTREEKRIKQ